MRGFEPDLRLMNGTIMAFCYAWIQIDPLPLLRIVLGEGQVETYVEVIVGEDKEIVLSKSLVWNCPYRDGFFVVVLFVQADNNLAPNVSIGTFFKIYESYIIRQIHNSWF